MPSTIPRISGGPSARAVRGALANAGAGGRRHRRHLLRRHLLAGRARPRRRASSASRPAAASAGTPSSGSTTARSPRPTTAPPPATACSTISAASCRRRWQTPKLMWLKRNLPETWERAGQFFDLADFLTWKASGSTPRSQCTLTCKWTYLAHERAGWQQRLLRSGRPSPTCWSAAPCPSAPASSAPISAR